MTRDFFALGGDFPSPDGVKDEMAQLVRKAAEPAQIGERTGTQIQRAAVRLGQSVNWTRKFWYRERAAVDAYELLRTRAIVARLEERRRVRAELRDQISQQAGLVDQRDVGPLVGMARKTGPQED